MKYQVCSFAVPSVLVFAMVMGFGRGVSVQEAKQTESGPSLTETLEWIRSRIDADWTDTTGVKLRTRFRGEGCRASFRKDGGTLTLSTAAFNLKDIGYLAVLDRPVGTLWTGTFLVFKTATGQSGIARGELSAADGRLSERSAASFDWHLGSVPIRSSAADLHEIGNRLRNAFTRAVELCGGAIKKEPF